MHYIDHATIRAMQGALQQPIEREEQLQAGVLFTGVSATYLNEVVERDGDMVLCQPHPAKVSLLGHVHTLTRQANGTVSTPEQRCACGQAWWPLSVILPETPGNHPRAFALEPTGGMEPLKLAAVYGMLERGQLKTFTTSLAGKVVMPSTGRPQTPGQDEHYYPLITKAVLLWAAPDELVEALRQGARTE